MSMFTCFSRQHRYVSWVKLASRTLRFQSGSAQPYLIHVEEKVNSFAESQAQLLLEPLEHADKTVHGLIQKEKQSKNVLINLVPSANYTSQSVLSALGSVLQNPNSEGYVGARYFPGTQFMDEVERLCQKRALEAFGLDDAVWGVNVQSHSRELATLQAYSALLAPHDRLLALGLPQGSYVAKYFTAIAYSPSEIDYKALEDIARAFSPCVVSSRFSSFSQLADYGAIDTICRKVGAYFMADITEISGLMTAGLIKSPFEQSDVVVSGTQGSLRGPCGALIFFRKAVPVKRVDGKGSEEIWNLGSAIAASVFPRHQGGPHNHTMMAMAVAMKQAQTATFKRYQSLALANATAVADRLLDLGCVISGNGTQNHQFAIKLDVIDANYAKEVMDEIGVVCSAVTATSELRLGSYAMTSRGLLPEHFCRVADIVYRGLMIAKELSGIKDAEVTSEGTKALLPGQETSRSCIRESWRSKILDLRQEVEEWMCQFEVPWK